jgi:MFS family permease
MYTVDVQHVRALPLRARLWSGVAPNVFFLGATSLLTDLSAELVTSVLPSYMAFALQLTPLQIGLVDGLQHGAAALSRVAGAWVADRTRRDKEVAAAGYLLSALCKLPLLGATSWSALSQVTALDRLGKGLRTGPRDALISFSSAPAQRGLAFGIHRGMDTLGALGGPLLAFALLASLPGSYDVVFVASFCIALVAVSVLLLFVRNARPAQAQAAGALPWRAAVAQLAGEPRFLRLGAAGLLLSMATVGDAFFYLALQRGTSIPAAAVPLFFVVTAVVYLLLVVPLGHLADRVGRRRVFLAGHALLLLACVLLLGLFLRPAWPWLGFAALGLLGAYYACTDGVLMAAASAVVPVPLRATGLGVIATGAALGRLLASARFGVARSCADCRRRCCCSSPGWPSRCRWPRGCGRARRRCGEPRRRRLAQPRAAPVHAMAPAAAGGRGRRRRGRGRAARAAGAAAAGGRGRQ